MTPRQRNRAIDWTLFWAMIIVGLYTAGLQ